MRYSILAILFFSAACASYRPTPADLAEELMTTDPPGTNFREISEDIHVDQAVLDAMRERASSQGERLLAVVRMPRGIHPYVVIAWSQSGDTIQVRGTAVYWGRVDAKWNTVATVAELAALSDAAEEFECIEGPVPSGIYGRGFVRWKDDAQITCEAGTFVDRDFVFDDRLEEVLNRAAETYNLFSEPPSN
jgi:hypothetical protein